MRGSRFALAALLGAASTPALAEYPDRPIQIVVPYTPAGTATRWVNKLWFSHPKRLLRRIKIKPRSDKRLIGSKIQGDLRRLIRHGATRVSILQISTPGGISPAQRPDPSPLARFTF